ncbi:MAG: malto-oligosyltrehalose trehalohydrolase [Actinomycetota bacterium]|nr:malto-oligosyltrehalose trehalohydrolase [Nitrospiraceae bacterium]MDA8157176.1 malto-oligosyltrehalose trehalohydrolase [Actinomycetota bacterium]
MAWHLDFGANIMGNGVSFRVWAPLHEKVSVRLVLPAEISVPMGKRERGWFEAFVPGVGAGARYFYTLGDTSAGNGYPDPASRYQPLGVHGPSEVVDPGFNWSDDAGWENVPIHDYIIYELHVGTFTPEGTFRAVAGRIPYLKELGVTAVELMPVAQFPGRRNWGYDGAYPFAPQNSYGGGFAPRELKELVLALHKAGIAAILDVVYNHLGPEGNYLGKFGPYFSGIYHTPWGGAINYDGPGSDDVRRYFIANALYWFTEYHFDALRLDAVHGIYDNGPQHIISELMQSVEDVSRLAKRPFYIFIESDRNDSHFIRPIASGGCGVDAHWDEDFHHCLHVMLTGEEYGYYLDFAREAHQLFLKTLREGFAYTGQYSKCRDKRHGSASWDIQPEKFIVFSQNHDQVGNRGGPGFLSARLAQGLPEGKLKLAAFATLLSPYLPLLFMGEEYGEKAPFFYFTDHQGPELANAVREGRKKEFAEFLNHAEVPDPQLPTTFEKSRPDTGLLSAPWHLDLFEFYKKLIRARKEKVSPLRPCRKDITAYSQNGVIIVRIASKEGAKELLLAMNFSGAQAQIICPGGVEWTPVIYSGELASSEANLKIGPYGAALLEKKGQNN